MELRETCGIAEFCTSNKGKCSSVRVWNDDWVFRGEDRAFERKEKSDAAKERGVFDSSKGSKLSDAELSKKIEIILRSRARLIVCFLTFPLYASAVWLLLMSGKDINTLMWVYIGLYVFFGIDMVRRRCPSCNEQFFVKTTFLNAFSKSCVHCGVGRV